MGLRVGSDRNILGEGFSPPGMTLQLFQSVSRLGDALRHLFPKKYENIRYVGQKQIF